MALENKLENKAKTPGLSRSLVLDVVRVTEQGALAAAGLVGRGEENAADQAAVDAMRRALNSLPVDGVVVIGEGERDDAPMLFIGERVGTGAGPAVDVALDPLEGTTLTAKALPNALSVLAVARKGGLLAAPDVYMDKIAIGGGYPRGLVDLDASPQDNIAALACAAGVEARRITACILDRPRHADLIDAVRATGAAVRLISDGDVAGVIDTTSPATGIDIYMGRGGAPEGVLAAAALRCVGGQMQTRLVLDTPDRKARARHMGIGDFTRVYSLEEMVSQDVMFSATGVTDGGMLQGVRYGAGAMTTESVVMRAHTGTVRWVRTRHRLP